MYFREVADTKRLFVLVLIMIGVAVTSAGIGGWGLYQAALDEQKNWLRELVQIQVSMINHVARSHVEHDKMVHPDGTDAIIKTRILDAHIRPITFGKSGEFTFAQRDGDMISFLEAGRSLSTGIPQPVSFDEEVAQPMQRALLGKSGTMIGLDYRGVAVLAAFKPVAVLNIGIVAKMDMSEIRAPFIRVGIIGGLGTLFVVILGAVLTLRISTPFVNALQLQSQMLNNMSEGVFLVRSEDTSIVYTNPKLEAMFGYDTGELMGKNASVLNGHNETDAARSAHAITDALKEKGSWTGEVCSARKDGTTFWCHTAISSFNHPEFGEVWVSAHEDISERKKTEAALMQSEQRFRAIADYTYDWEIWLGVHGDVKWVNPAVERVTGYPVRECLEMADFPLGIMHEDNRAAMSEYRSESLYEGMDSDIDARVVCKNGDVLWAAFSYQPIYDDDETFLGSRWSIRDIGARKRLESDLLHAKLDAEKANSAKSEFLAGMSHDLRTPLNAIMGFSDMMRSKTFGPLGDAHYEAYADDIYNSGDLLVSLINDILDLSKVEAGKYDLVEDSLDMPALIASSFRQVQNMADLGELTLTTALAPDLPHLCGDKKVLSQILNNLLSNAIKFTPAGGAVNVTARLDDDNGFLLSVADEGIGMSETDIVKAMQPFEQVSGKNAREHDGTGLGLPLCANFMALHDGEIKIESAVGKGTTVTVRFPPDRTILI